MQSFLIQLLLAILFVNTVYSQVIKCPVSPLIADFDKLKYIGKWYEIEKNSPGFETNLKCITAEYKLFNDSAISVLNSGINIFTNQYDSINGYAFVPNSQEPNKLKVKLNVQIGPGVFIETTGSYDIWDTDYNNYALVYSCQFAPVTNLKIENVFILSRTPTLSSTILLKLKAQLAAANVDVSKLEVTVQNC